MAGQRVLSVYKDSILMSISYSVFCVGFFFFFCASENFCVSILLKYIHHYYDAGQSESRFQFFDPGEA
jgi:hypothetical protein